MTTQSTTRKCCSSGLSNGRAEQDPAGLRANRCTTVPVCVPFAIRHRLMRRDAAAPFFPLRTFRRQSFTSRVSLHIFRRQTSAPEVPLRTSRRQTFHSELALRVMRRRSFDPEVALRAFRRRSSALFLFSGAAFWCLRPPANQVRLPVCRNACYPLPAREGKRACHAPRLLSKTRNGCALLDQ
jgi:hypothetical protein